MLTDSAHECGVYVGSWAQESWLLALPPYLSVFDALAQTFPVLSETHQQTSLAKEVKCVCMRVRVCV